MSRVQAVGALALSDPVAWLERAPCGEGACAQEIGTRAMQHASRARSGLRAVKS